MRIRSLNTVPNLPDSFFTPTSSDLKSAQATLSSRTRNLNDAPLQLRASREAALQARAEKYPNVRYLSYPNALLCVWLISRLEEPLDDAQNPLH